MTAQRSIRLTVIDSQSNYTATIWLNENGQPLDGQHQPMSLDGDTLVAKDGEEWRISPESVTALRSARQ